MAEREVLNLAKLDRLERERRTPATTDPPYGIRVLSIDDLNFLGDQLRPLLELVDRLGEILAMRGCVRRGPGGHYNSVRCLDQGTREHGSNEYGDKPLAKEKWCDGCTALAHYQRAKGGSP